MYRLPSAVGVWLIFLPGWGVGIEFSAEEYLYSRPVKPLPYITRHSVPRLLVNVPKFLFEFRR